MLLNLSNHPYDKWPDNQKATARRLYGKVIDMEFPNINPEWTKDQVFELSEEFVAKIKLQSPAAIHLMGELTFCYILANLLKELGIPCVASTTERLVVQQGDHKLSTFRFVQFRNYF